MRRDVPNLTFFLPFARGLDVIFSPIPAADDGKDGCCGSPAIWPIEVGLAHLIINGASTGPGSGPDQYGTTKKNKIGIVIIMKMELQIYNNGTTK